jgi:serine/threonine protein phosphatase PrpC
MGGSMQHRHPYVQLRAHASDRTSSEDAVEVIERDGTLVVALADGAGGLRGGATASQAFVDAVRSSVSDPSFPIEETHAWGVLFRAVDATLAKNMVGETTGVVVVVTPTRVLGVSTGDSEAWVVSRDGVDDLTVGQHTRRRLGCGHVSPAAFERHPLDGVLLVASDGLFRHAASEVIARIVRESTLGVAGERLVELVRLRSGKLADDVAIILAQPARPAVS